MKRTSLAALCLLLFILGGCAHTELTRRYKSKNYATAPRDYVTVSAFVMTPPQPPKSTLLSQISTPEGQAALISKMAEWAKSPEELYKALTVSEKGEEAARTIDKTVFKKRVVFSVGKEQPGKGPDDLTPADRISSLIVTLNFKDNNNKPFFVDWDKFDTQWGTVDLGTLKRSQHARAEGTLEVGPATDVKVPVAGKANVSRETTIEESINFKHRYISMNGAIRFNNEKKRQEAVLLQESQVVLDLAGNFSVDFTIDITDQKRSGFIILSAVEKDDKPLKPVKVKKSGKPSKSEEVKIDFGSLIYPVNSNPVQCEITSDYTIRHLRQLPLYDRYDRELAEGLHRVVFVSGKSKVSDVELLSEKELRTIIYQIVLDDHTYLYLGMPIDDPLIKGDKYDKEPIYKNPLRFMKLAEAKRFLSLLRDSSFALKKSEDVKIGKYKIYRGKDNPIKKEDIPNLKIRAKKLN